MSEADPYGRHRAAFHAMLDPDLYTGAWLDAQVASGAIRAIGNDDACVLVRIREFPTGAREVQGEAATGPLPAIRALIVEAENWGRSKGCTGARIESRAGWARELHAAGWAVFQTVLRKEIA